MDSIEIALVLQQKMREDFYWCRCDDIGVLEAIADWHIAEVEKQKEKWYNAGWEDSLRQYGTNILDDADNLIEQMKADEREAKRWEIKLK